MALSPQQEKFAKSIADGMSQSDAYRAAYSTSGWKQEAIHVNASKVASNAKVALRIDQLKAKLAEQELWTRADSVNTLKGVISDPESRCSDKTAAVKVLNEMHGYNAPIKYDINGKIEILSSDQATRMAKEFINEYG